MKSYTWDQANWLSSSSAVKGMKHRMNYVVIFILCFVRARISRVDSYQRFIHMVSRINLHTVCETGMRVGAYSFSNQSTNKRLSSFRQALKILK